MVVYPGTNRNYTARAGDLWNSSIVAAALGWMGANAPQAPLVCWRVKGGKLVRQPHALDLLLAKPNPYYSWSVLVASLLLSLVVSGNAYCYVVRNGMGLPIELWWIPHTQIEPSWGSNATTEEWISHYTYRGPDGIQRTLLNEDVIHFREGALDPRNPRKSLSRLASALRIVAKQHDVENYEAAIIANMGIPGLVVTPTDSNTSIPEPETFRDLLYDRISGDERGKPFVSDSPVSVQQLGFNPEQLLLDTASDRPEATLCALIGISPITLNLKVGLAEATYDNKKSANRESWENGLVPRLIAIGQEFTGQLVPLFEDAEGIVITPDTSQVAALRPDLVAEWKRLKDAVGGPFLMIQEARAEAGLPPLSEEELALLETLRTKTPAHSSGDTTGGTNAQN